MNDFDFLVVGAGIAGASVAAHLAEKARVALLEMEDRPGYHTTGRSASSYEPNYGPEPIQILTRVAGSQIQRTVIFVIGLQFGAQIVGFVIASVTDRVGVGGQRPTDRLDEGNGLRDQLDVGGLAFGVEVLLQPDVQVAAAFERHDFHARRGKFFRKDAARPAKSNEHNIDFFQFFRHVIFPVCL